MYRFRFLRGAGNMRVDIRRREPLEPQDVFLDSLAKKKEGEMGAPEVSSEVPLPRIFLYAFLAFALSFLAYAVLQAFQFQILQEEQFLAQASANKSRLQHGQSERGVIYDRNGEQLVFNRQSFRFAVHPEFLPEEETALEQLLQEVERLTGVAPVEVQKIIEESEEGKAFVLNDVDHETLVALQPRLEDLHGFDLEVSFKRSYVDPPYFSHLLGYTGKISREEFKEDPEWYTVHDWVGNAGAEKHYEDLLRNFPGRIFEERDVNGNVVRREVVEKPEPGKSLVLWLDAQLQRVAHESLSSGLEELGSEKGAVIALDPNTGGVLSMVSIPSYDNTRFQYGTQEEIASLFSDPLSPVLNRAIAGLYPTGSSVKPVIALAALEEGLISPSTQIYAGGKIEIPHRYDPDIVYTFRDLRSYGWTDMRKAIAQSVNVFFYAIGGGYEDQEGLGVRRIGKYLELFGFGERTGVDLPGEAQGLVPSPEWKMETKEEPWWDGDTYLLSIGQGNFLSTPLQLASAFVPIANGGTRYTPRVVREAIDSSGNRVEEFPPKVRSEGFFDPEHATIVREGMRDAVRYGSAVHLQQLPVSAAAKTGTAQTGTRDVFHNWVVVLAPYEDPEIVLVVLVEEVEGLRQAVLPIAGNILEWYFTEGR